MTSKCNSNLLTYLLYLLVGQGRDTRVDEIPRIFSPKYLEIDISKYKVLTKSNKEV